MTRLSRRIFLSITAVFAVPGGNALADSGKPPARPASEKRLAVGALLPLSGAQSLIGDECLRGITLAVEAINQEGGIGGAIVQLATGDAYDQTQAPNAAQTLIGQSHPFMILGTGASAISYPGSAAAELAQIPYIELNAPADGIMTRGFRFLLRPGLTTTMIANTAIAAIQARFPDKKIGLLFNTGATGGAIAAAALSNLQAAKTPPLISIGYPVDIADLHEPVSRLQRAGAEVVLHAADATDVLVFYAAMQAIGWKPKALIGCGDGYMLRETAYALGNAFEATIAVGAPFYPPRAAYLADAYQDRYAMPPRSPDSLTSFVGAKLVFDRLKQSGGDPAKLLDNLRKTDIPTSTLANGWGAAFDKNGQNTRSFASLQQWKNASLTPLA